MKTIVEGSLQQIFESTILILRMKRKTFGESCFLTYIRLSHPSISRIIFSKTCFSPPYLDCSNRLSRSKSQKKFCRTASLLRFLAVRVKIRQKLYSLPAEYVDCGTFPLCRYCPLTDFFLSIYSKSRILNVQPHKMCHSGL